MRRAGGRRCFQRFRGAPAPAIPKKRRLPMPAKRANCGLSLRRILRSYSLISAAMLEESREFKIKTVGHRRLPAGPAERLAASWKLEQEVNRINPWPRPRGFVFKAKTWAEYEQWRASQENPRLW